MAQQRVGQNRADHLRAPWLDHHVIEQPAGPQHAIARIGLQARGAVATGHSFPLDALAAQCLVTGRLLSEHTCASGSCAQHPVSGQAVEQHACASGFVVFLP